MTEITDDFVPFPSTDVGVIVHLNAALRLAAGTVIEILVEDPVFESLPLGDEHDALYPVTAPFQPGDAGALKDNAIFPFVAVALTERGADGNKFGIS